MHIIKFYLTMHNQLCTLSKQSKLVLGMQVTEPLTTLDVLRKQTANGTHIKHTLFYNHV